MKLILHNKVEIDNGIKTTTFYNTMLSSVFSKLLNFEPFAEYVSLGDELASDSQNNFHLSHKLTTCTLSNEIIQSDISKGVLFSKKSFTITDENLNGQSFKEIGLSDNSNNPIIYNYISLIDDNNPNGIKKESGYTLNGNIYIYLDIDFSDTELKFTTGENDFIKYLLGEGLDENIYACSGENLTPNSASISASEDYSNKTKYLCTITSESNSELKLNFQANIEGGVLNELVFLHGTTAFARINLQNFYNSVEKIGNFTSKSHYIIDLGEKVKDVKTVQISDSDTPENDYHVKKYASEIGAKISLPFDKSFNSNTPRFVSKNGEIIIFVNNDKLYIYKNHDYVIEEINSNNLVVQDVKNIICIDSTIFVISSIEPYIFMFEIENSELFKKELDLSEYEDLDEIKNSSKIDIAKTNDGNFMISYIESISHYGNTIFTTNENGVTKYNHRLKSEHNFSYILAITANNFCDARIMFCEEGEYSYTCRLVTHFSDKTENDTYTALAYYFTKNTKELYVKNRGVVVEKTSSPKIFVYHYPQIYQFQFSNIDDMEDYYLSEDLLYIATKDSTGSFNFYNLVGYNTATIFNNQLPSTIDKTKIENIVFLSDSVLIFYNDENQKIIGYNLKETGTLLENVSSNNTNYTVTYNEYKLIGENNEGVTATLSVILSLWFFQTN